MHIRLDTNTDSSGTSTPLFGPRRGPITNATPPATQSDILGILQREQDHAMTLLSLSPLLSSLFLSYANRAAALELASITPSPESEEWNVLQTAVATLREENEKLKSETHEMAEKLGVAEASQDAFRSQVSSLKELNAAQQDDAKSLWAELFEAGDKYDRLMEDSNMEKSTLQVQVLDLEVQQRELKDTIVKQQVKISKLEHLMTDDSLTHAPPLPPMLPVFPRTRSPSSRGSPVLHVRPPLSEQSEAVPVPSLISTPTSNFRVPGDPSDTSPSLNPRSGKSRRKVPASRLPSNLQACSFL